MKKVKYFIIFVGLLILTGCSERELTFDRVYPDTSRLEEARAKNKLEVENLVVTLNEQNTPPRDLFLFRPNSSRAYIVIGTQFCWAIKSEECENMQPIHPNDKEAPNYTLEFLHIAANEEFHIEVDTLNGPGVVPYPTRIEAYIYDKNNNLHLHEAIDNSGMHFVFTAPSKPDSYTFLFKAYYEGNVKGISYHPHGILVTSAN